MTRTPTPEEVVARVRELAAKAGHVCPQCDGTGHLSDGNTWRRCDCQLGGDAA